jgi:inosine-uridine nucleoside N-ribohydrolase
MHDLPRAGGSPLWVDTDIALGSARGDVDDGFALAAIALAAGSRLLGVSAVSGNTDGTTAHTCADRLLRMAGIDCPRVTEGDAPAELARLPPGTSVLAIGPPSNLLRAAEIDPGLPRRIEVRVVGRVRNPIRNPLLPLCDLNFRSRSARPFWRLTFRELRVFPLDVVRRLRFDAADLARLESTAVGAYLAQHSRRWLTRARRRFLQRSFPVWDLVPALDAVGRLPGAVFEGNPGAALAEFDVAAARDAFFRLLGGETTQDRGAVSSTRARGIHL